MNNFDKISERIKKEQIKPVPKWFFILKNIGGWGLFILFILIGAIAFSIILFSIQQSDFELISHLDHSKTEKLLVILPFFWIIILIVFTLFAYFSFRNSKKAYKYSLMSIIGVSTFLSVLLGILFFLIGGGQRLERSFANKVSAYKSLEEKKLQVWVNPTEGLLAGTIIRNENDTIYLRDFSDKKWLISHKGIFVPPILNLESGEKIKLIGKPLGDNIFIADEIRPWQGMKKHLGQKNNSQKSERNN
jgi:hypothetical protein